MHIVIKESILYQLGHITPHCSIQWPRSFNHTAAKPTFQHPSSTPYQPRYSNPYALIAQFALFIPFLSGNFTFLRSSTFAGAQIHLNHFVLVC